MIKVSLLLLLGLTACALLRRRSAALRHLVLATAVVGAAVAPGVELLFPAWDMRTVAAAGAFVGAENATPTSSSYAGPQQAPSITGRKHAFWEGLRTKIDLSALGWIWIGGTGAVALVIGTFGSSAQSRASFTGRVLDPSQTGLANATVMLRGVDSGDRFEAQTDATGRFEFTRVPFGDYILEARAPGRATSKGSVRLEGRDLTRDLRLDAGS